MVRMSIAHVLGPSSETLQATTPPNGIYFLRTPSSTRTLYRGGCLGGGKAAGVEQQQED